MEWSSSIEEDKAWLLRSKEVEWDAIESKVEEPERVVATAQVCAYELDADESWRELARGEWMMLYLVEGSANMLRIAAVDPATGELAIASTVGPDAQLDFADAEGEVTTRATTFGELSCGEDLPMFGVRFGDSEQGLEFSRALRTAAKMMPRKEESVEEARATLRAIGFDVESIEAAFRALGAATADALANWIIETEVVEEDEFSDVTFTREAFSLTAWTLVEEAARATLTALDSDSSELDDPERITRAASNAAKLARQLLFDGDKRRDGFWVWVTQRAAKQANLGREPGQRASQCLSSIRSDVETRVASAVLLEEEEEEEEEEPPAIIPRTPPPPPPEEKVEEIPEEKVEAHPPPPPTPEHKAPSKLRRTALASAIFRINPMMMKRKKKKEVVADDHPSDLVERAMRRAGAANLELSAQPFVPADFEPYRVLGRGSFGVVALAKRRSDGQIFAIKVLEKRRLVGQRAESMARLERDVLDRLSQQRTMPFVARLRFAFHSASKLYIAMDFYPNGSLHSVLAKDSQTRRYGRRAAKMVATQLACALEHVHKACVIHRDVKPSNVLVDARGHVALSDFGLATRVSVRGGDLRKRSFVGTIDYAAPELLLKSSTRYNHAVDCWALGCLVFEMCAGQPPFHAATTRETFARIVRAEPKWKTIVNLKDETRHALELLLQKDPKLRLGADGFYNKVHWFSGPIWGDAIGANEPPLETFLRDAKVRQPDLRVKDPEAAGLFSEDTAAALLLGSSSRDAFGGFGRPPSARPQQQQQPPQQTVYV
ncbi:hypothetical protein CTAYLR_004100 [Chrysophaeum taylorii]|uniref:non-specific serine/threonine protein kinase n=1 Tax=Chrysophaeum taylorii TaxID=2483200 RepID=A0AAD7UCU3_9STRA|nr:hypothetical protein CTAYLR_004100 [Chrysophaeum taylorii]